MHWKKLSAVFVTISGAVYAQPMSCASSALLVAENAYSNYIHETRTKVVVEGKQYKVIVGIGNQEDGPHTYMVTFRDAKCNAKNVQVCDLTQPGYGPSMNCPYR